MSKFLRNSSLISKYVAYYRLKKAVSLLPFSLKGKKVLVICCGRGFDSQFLADIGAKVTATDIKKEMVEETRKNCKGVKAMVADATELSFSDNEFDLVWVNDGLHHLDNPFQGLKEMYRVGKLGLVFLEAQKTFLTPFLVRIGIMEEYEEVERNYVYRFSRKEIKDFMESKKIKEYKIFTVWCQNIDWFNKHIYNRLDNKIGLVVFKILFRSFNFLFGYFGNSLIVVAVKDEK